MNHFDNEPRAAEIAARAFYGDAALERFVVPEGVERIGDNAFTNCRALRSVTLPASLRALGAGAFRWCASLERAALPEGLETVSDECFFGCEALREVRFPASLRAVGAWAFFKCAALGALSLPEGLEQIGCSAFRLGSALEEVALPEGLRRVEDKAFFECAALRRVSLPASLEALGEDAFGACPALEAFDCAPGGAFSAGDGALFAEGGTRLLRYPPAKPDAAWSVPVGVTEIAPGAFQGAKNLRELTLPEGLRRIGAMAFYNTALESLRLPRSVEPGEQLGRCGLDRTAVICETPEQAYWLDQPVLLGDLFALPENFRPAAAAGFLWAVEHGLREMEPWRGRYTAYLRAEAERYLCYARRDETLLHLMLGEDMVPPDMLPGLLDDAAERGRTDLTAELLDYQRRRGGAPDMLELDAAEDAEDAETPHPPDAPVFYGTGDS